MVHLIILVRRFNFYLLKRTDGASRRANPTTRDDRCHIYLQVVIFLAAVMGYEFDQILQTSRRIFWTYIVTFVKPLYRMYKFNI
jgi:hypothetical protein